MRAAVLCFLTAFVQEASLQDVLRSLEDDSIEVREQAATELVKRGEALLPDLRKARRAAASEEVRARLGDVVVAIEADKRRREFKGGPVVEGLCARLDLVEEQETSGRRFKVEIMNVGATPREVVAIRSWDRVIPRHRSSSSSSEARITVTRLSPEPPGAYRGSVGIGCGGRPVRTFVALKPGESRVAEYRLNTQEMSAGDYEVVVEYYAKALLRTEENLRSNAVRFSVGE